MTNRGNAGERIFLSDREREKILKYLKTAFDRFSLIVHAYYLMATHYYLQVETPEATISKALQLLNVNYVVYFNKK